MQPSEEIKSKLDIVDVIREYIALKPAGVNFRAPCPFHRENTPSFVVSPEKQIWHCFGCGKGGDIFSFVMEYEGINFAEALRQLAPKAGVTMKRHDPKMASERNRMLDIIEASRKYYHDILISNPQAKLARKYLKERGLTEETIDDWRIGYAPNSWDDLLIHLKQNGFRDPAIHLAGMSARKDNTNRFYNRFRGRIMFPICDINGNPVGFSARVSPEMEAEEKLGKYINSPQTLIYDKSKILFGLDKAKMEIKRQDAVVIVEGQMDVITAHQHGFKNVIAQSGTALTGDQIKLIKRYTNNIYFALDADNAGQMAIERGEEVVYTNDYAEIEEKDMFGRTKKYIDPLLSHNINIKVVEIPEGKDPDDCIRKDPKQWEEALKNAKNIMQYHFDRVFAGQNLEDVDNKRKIAGILLPKIAKINNTVEYDHWIKVLAEKLNTEETALREALRQHEQAKRPDYQKKEVVIAPKKENKSRDELLSELFLALIIKFGELLGGSVEAITIDHISGKSNKEFYKNMIIYYNEIVNNQSLLNYRDFRNWLEKIGENQLSMLQLLDKLVLLGDESFLDFDLNKAKIELLELKKNLKLHYLKSRKKEIEMLIAEKEKEGDEVMVMELMKELKYLSEEAKEE